MKQKIIETIKKYNLINSGDKIVLGVSGGPDSIAMLDILNQLKDEMNFYAEQVHDIVSTTVSAFIKDDGTLANVIEEKETQIDDINKRIKKQNLKRVKKEKHRRKLEFMSTNLRLIMREWQIIVKTLP